MPTIAQKLVKIVKKSDTRTTSFAKIVKKMLTMAFSTTFDSNSYDFNVKIYFVANFEKKSPNLETTKFLCSHQKFKITPRNNIPPVHRGVHFTPREFFTGGTTGGYPPYPPFVHHYGL